MWSGCFFVHLVENQHSVMPTLDPASVRGTPQDMRQLTLSIVVLTTAALLIVSSVQACVKAEVLTDASDEDRVSLEALRNDCNDGMRLLREGRATDALPLLKRAAARSDMLVRDVLLPLAEAMYEAGASVEEALVAWEAVHEPVGLVEARRLELVQRLPVGRAAALLKALPNRSAAFALKQRARRDGAKAELFRVGSPEIAGRLGVLLPLSGKLEAFGKQVLRGLRAGLDDDTTLYVRDVAAKGVSFRSLVDELESLGVTAVLGPLSRNHASKIAPLVHARNIPLIRLTVEDPTIERSRWTFRAFLSRGSQCEAQVARAMSKGASQFAVLHADSPYGKALSSVFTKAVESLGGSAVIVQSYPVGSNNLTESIKKLAKHSFDGLYVASPASQAGTVLRFLAREDIWSRRRGRSGTTKESIRYIHLLAPSEWKNTQTLQDAGRYLYGVVVPTEWPGVDDPGTKRFVGTIRRAFGLVPGLFEAVGYDAIRLVQAARADSRLALSDRLRQIKGFDGVLGTTRFNDEGEPVRKARLYRAGTKGFEPLP